MPANKDIKDHTHWAMQAKLLIVRMRTISSLGGTIPKQDWSTLDQYLLNMTKTMPKDKRK